MLRQNEGKEHRQRSKNEPGKRHQFTGDLMVMVEGSKEQTNPRATQNTSAADG